MSKNGAQPITDLARPRLPFPISVINSVGAPLAPRLISLDEDNLIATARKKTGLSDFGDESFRGPLQVFLHAIKTDAKPSTLGRFLGRQFLLQLLSSRLLIQDLINRHPEILEERIEKPIVIAGLPRTGTTHLHNLMSQDPNLRHLPYWESLEPVLPASQQPKSWDRDPRMKRCDQAIKMLNYVMPLFPAMHEMSTEAPHEEIQLLAIHFSTVLFENMYFVPSYRDWYKANDHTEAYQYLYKALQVLQWLRGPKRWVLKSPQHLEQFGPLIAAFPDARIIQTHRDPVRITASMCTMDTYGKRMNNCPIDPHINGRYWADRTEDLLRASVKDRPLIPESQVIDVRFHEYMTDQITMVKRVYQFAEQPFSDETAKALQCFIDNNPKGKHGTVRYRLEDFGIDADERREALRFYQERFDVPDE